MLIIGPTNYITVNEDMVNFAPNEMLSQTINNVTTYAKFITYDELTNRLYYIKLISTLSFVSGTAIVGTN